MQKCIAALALAAAANAFRPTRPRATAALRIDVVDMETVSPQSFPLNSLVMVKDGFGAWRRGVVTRRGFNREDSTVEVTSFPNDKDLVYNVNDADVSDRLRHLDVRPTPTYACPGGELQLVAEALPAPINRSCACEGEKALSIAGAKGPAGRLLAHLSILDRDKAHYSNSYDFVLVEVTTALVDAALAAPCRPSWRSSAGDRDENELWEFEDDEGLLDGVEFDKAVRGEDLPSSPELLLSSDGPRTYGISLDWNNGWRLLWLQAANRKHIQLKLEPHSDMCCQATEPISTDSLAAFEGDFGVSGFANVAPRLFDPMDPVNFITKDTVEDREAKGWPTPEKQVMRAAIARWGMDRAAAGDCAPVVGCATGFPTLSTEVLYGAAIDEGQARLVAGAVPEARVPCVTAYAGLPRVWFTRGANPIYEYRLKQHVTAEMIDAVFAERLAKAPPVVGRMTAERRNFEKDLRDTVRLELDAAAEADAEYIDSLYLAVELATYEKALPAALRIVNYVAPLGVDVDVAKLKGMCNQYLLNAFDILESKRDDEALTYLAKITPSLCHHTIGPLAHSLEVPGRYREGSTESLLTDGPLRSLVKEYLEAQLALPAGDRALPEGFLENPIELVREGVCKKRKLVYDATCEN